MGPFYPHGFGYNWSGILAEVVAGLFFILIAVIVIGVLVLLVRFLIVGARAAELYIREHEPKVDAAPVATTAAAPAPAAPAPAAAAAVPAATTTSTAATTPIATKPIATKAPTKPRTPKAPPTV
jgi:cytoskeletal protein RodZ